MFRRLKHWFRNDLSLSLARGFINIFPAIMRMIEMGASPEKQERLRQKRLEFETMQRDARDLERSLGELKQELPQNAALKRLELTEKFNEKYAPEHTDWIREQKESLLKRQDERAAVDALRTEAGDDTEKRIDLLRTHLAEHPEHSLAEASLIGALRKTGHYDDAITIVRKQLAGIDRQNDLHYIGLFGASNVLASLLTQKGEPREAVLVLEKLLAEYPKVEFVSRAGVYATLAEAYEKSNNREEARKNWKRVASYTEYKELTAMAKQHLAYL